MYIFVIECFWTIWLHDYWCPKSFKVVCIIYCVCLNNLILLHELEIDIFSRKMSSSWKYIECEWTIWWTLKRLLWLYRKLTKSLNLDNIRLTEYSFSLETFISIIVSFGTNYIEELSWTLQEMLPCSVYLISDYV